jgi:hypothetical protein
MTAQGGVLPIATDGDARDRPAVLREAEGGRGRVWTSIFAAEGEFACRVNQVRRVELALIRLG